MGLVNMNCNSCDGCYNSLDVHFTGHCDNKCSFCIDSCNRKEMRSVPNVENIVNTITMHQKEFDDVLILGGEPCLYLRELVSCVEQIKEKTDLKVYVTTSVPYTCYTQKKTFIKLLSLVNGINFSVQHYKEEKANLIRNSISKYDRQEFYNSLPSKNKIRITFNLVKPYFNTREEIVNCISNYDKMGFGQILIRELQHTPESFVSFEKVMGMHLPSAYAHGCQMNIKIPGESFKTPIILKRSCPVVEESLKVTWDDVLKAFLKTFKAPPNNNFGVVWEDGSLTKGW